jgi:hypothetical protein
LEIQGEFFKFKRLGGITVKNNRWREECEKLVSHFTRNGAKQITSIYRVTDSELITAITGHLTKNGECVPEIVKPEQKEEYKNLLLFCIDILRNRPDMTQELNNEFGTDDSSYVSLNNDEFKTQHIRLKHAWLVTLQMHRLSRNAFTEMIASEIPENQTVREYLKLFPSLNNKVRKSLERLIG